MKLVMLLGSPNKNGSSNFLAERFAKGAREAGHTVETVDTAHANIHACTGCARCSYEGTCVQKDDMEQIRRLVLNADMLVFVTPLYYYGMSAQMKTLIDRFCAFNSSLQRRSLRSALIVSARNDDEWTFQALESYYFTLVRYLNLKDMGRILGAECSTPTMARRSFYADAAYRLGRSLKD